MKVGGARHFSSVSSKNKLESRRTVEDEGRSSAHRAPAEEDQRLPVKPLFQSSSNRTRRKLTRRVAERREPDDGREVVRTEELGGDDGQEGEEPASDGTVQQRERHDLRVGVGKLPNADLEETDC